MTFFPFKDSAARRFIRWERTKSPNDSSAQTNKAESKQSSSASPSVLNRAIRSLSFEWPRTSEYTARSSTDCHSKELAGRPSFQLDGYFNARKTFLRQFPAYSTTSDLDQLRAAEFRRLKGPGTVYVDYMGGCLYPESLVTDHMSHLTKKIMGNTHSDSPSSRASEEYVTKARKAVLSYFDAPEEDYVCIFTSNCSTALKLVGESFPFEAGSRFILAEDSHNSVNGIRRFAEAKGASVRYVPTTRKGGFAFNDMLSALQEDQQSASLVALTGQSNISGFRPDIPAILRIAKDLGYATLVDGAALVSTTSISLAANPTRPNSWNLEGNVDALAISFYKMFGYPTGIGALIARKDFLRKLRRPWFAGGTVDTVGLPCGVVESDVPWERFEEGTINYTGLVAIPNGLETLRRYLSGDTPILPLRLSTLHTWLYDTLKGVTHSNGQSVVVILSAAPNSVEPPATIDWNGTALQVKNLAPGYTLSMTFHHSDGQQIPLSEVSTRAAAAGISLRSGCMCNPGGAMGLLGLRHMMDRLAAASEAGSDGDLLTKNDVEQMIGEELGVIRISLGLVSDFRDVWSVASFVSTFVE